MTHKLIVEKKNVPVTVTRTVEFNGYRTPPDDVMADLCMHVLSYIRVCECVRVCACVCLSIMVIYIYICIYICSTILTYTYDVLIY